MRFRFLLAAKKPGPDDAEGGKPEHPPPPQLRRDKPRAEPRSAGQSPAKNGHRFYGR